MEFDFWTSEVECHLLELVYRGGSETGVPQWSKTFRLLAIPAQGIIQPQYGSEFNLHSHRALYLRVTMSTLLL